VLDVVSKYILFAQVLMAISETSARRNEAMMDDQLRNTVA
jgi:hypothetical protein